MTTPNEPDLNNASWMGLRFKPTSNSAIELGEELYRRIFPTAEAVGPGRPPDHEGRKSALVAIVADVLLATKNDPERLVHRKYSRGSFTGEPISYRNFRAVEQALVAQGYLIKHPGFWMRDTENDGFGHHSGFGRTTRWGGTPDLFALCQEFQITPQNIGQNFRVLLPDVVVQVRRPNRRDGRGRKIIGEVVEYSTSARSAEIEREVREINEFLNEHDIRGTVFLGFQRKFNNAFDIDSYGWNQGGRLYCVNYPDSYQCLPSEERSKIIIDGHSVVEIDIRASQLTAYLGLRGAPFDPQSGDPYDLDNVHRDVAKKWFVIAIGHGRFPVQWSPEASADYREETGGGNLGRDYPVQMVQAAFIRKHPAVGKLPISGLDSLDLSYAESEAVIAAMLKLLRNHKVPSLSVHDSLIVPEQYRELVTVVLSECYAEKIGIKPALEVKQAS